MKKFSYVPPDSVTVGKDNMAKRVLYMCTCVLCQRDFEIREGKFVNTWTKKGTRVRVLICSDCYEKEADDVEPISVPANGL